MDNLALYDQAGDGLAAVRQVADLAGKALDLKIRVSPDGYAFSSLGDPARGRAGVLAIEGRFDAQTATIAVTCVLLRVRPQQRAAIGDVLGILQGWLSVTADRARLLFPEIQPDGMRHLGLVLQVQASPLSPVRADRWVDQLKQLHQRASEAQAMLPVLETDPDLEKQYEKFSEHLQPVPPLPKEMHADASAFIPWAADTTDLLDSAGAVALCAPNGAETGFALALLALVEQRRHGSLGRLQSPTANARTVLEIAKAAPGVLVIPALVLSLGTSPYELGREVRGLLAMLQAGDRRVIFAGRFEELQAALSGGQGARQDPLLPVVRHVPEFPLGLLARHGARLTARAAGGLPPAQETRVAEAAVESLAGLPLPEQRRLLAPTVAKLVQDCLAGRGALAPQPAIVTQLKNCSETLGGLSNQAAGERSQEVQQNFARLADPAFGELLADRLPGQQKAITALHERIRTEALTRPANQPLRYCAQGTPGTGKSASAQFIADYLGIPYTNIDAASMSDPHTAASQLLGAGRGIVSSDRPGRIEQAARHHTGVVLEVSDLDHAPASVRSALADLFLQMLDTGVVQSAVGETIPCANLIAVFTVNLPDGQDERIRNPLGFSGPLSRREITERASAELKAFTSSAFLSRVGAPIVFDPLDAAALAAIEERAVRSAAATAAQRLGLRCRHVELEPGLGARLLSFFGSDAKAVGARAVIEHGRAMAAAAIARRPLHQGGATLFISLESSGELLITQQE
jgi:hypothetical protein